MIRAARPRGAVALLAVLALAVLGFGLRSPDPASADPPLAVARAEQLAAAASVADDALARLSEVLAAALDRARRGAARTVAGDRPPAIELLAAARGLEADAATGDAARRALDALAGTAASVDPGPSVPALSYSSPELLEIAAQLRATATAATIFVERRNATVAVVEALGAGVAALDASQPDLALDHLDVAVAPLAMLEAWEDGPPLLRYWMTIIGRLLDAARGIAEATIDGDSAAVAAAAVRYREAGALAGGADNALAVSLAEAGAAVSATPLQRLAALAGEAADIRAALGQ